MIEQNINNSRTLPSFFKIISLTSPFVLSSNPLTPPSIPVHFYTPCCPHISVSNEARTCPHRRFASISPSVRPFISSLSAPAALFLRYVYRIDTCSRFRGRRLIDRRKRDDAQEGFNPGFTRRKEKETGIESLQE